MLPREVLGIDAGASPDEVRAAFRRYAARHHPDHGGDVATFVAGQEAYRTLLGQEPDAGPASDGGDVVFHRQRSASRALRRALTLATHRFGRRPIPPPRVR